MKPFLIMRDRNGHEVAICCEAARTKRKVLILPKAATAAEYYKKAYEILYFMSFFYAAENFIIPSFEDREMYEEVGQDWVADLRAGKFDQAYWDEFASHTLTPTRGNEIQFSVSSEAILWVPQKLVTNGLCGVTAEQQSLFPEFFWFMEEKEKVMFQHYNKVADKPAVDELLQKHPSYAPGVTENPDLLGLRGISHEMYINLLSKVKGCVGIAGTHSWEMLTMFPWKPQIHLYNKAGVERWDQIEKAYQKQGYPVRCCGFEDGTDKEAFSMDVAEVFTQLFK